MPAFSLRKKCSWCLQYEAHQRGEELDVQHVMTNPWERAATDQAPVTIALVAINFLVFIVGMATNTPPTVGANWGPYTLGSEPWRLVSHMFFHDGYLHIGLNMWFLYALGRECEQLLGSVTYTVMYFLTGICGGLFSLWWHPWAPSVGASGALFGILGTMIGAYKFGEFSMPRALIRASLKSMLWCAGINLGLGLMGSVDNAAHIGGLVSGLAFGALVAKAAPEPSAFGRRAAIMVLIGAVLASAFIAMRKHPGAVVPRMTVNPLGSKDVKRQIAALEEKLASTPNDLAIRVRLASYYEMDGRNTDAIQQYQWAILHTPKEDERHETAGLLLAALYRKTSTTEGQKFFSDLANRAPDDPVAHEGLGTIAETEGHDDIAIAEFQKWAALAPRSADAHIRVGAALVRVRRYDEALAAYQKAVDLTSDDPEIQFGIKQDMEEIRRQRDGK